MTTTTAPPPGQTIIKAPFGADHIRAACREVLLPPEVAEADLAWGWRLNSVDLSSSHGFTWPGPGHWAQASGPFTASPEPCPASVGDGLCVAKTITGAQSGKGCFTHHVALLVAYLPADVLAENGDKLRVKRAWVAGLADPVRALVAAKDRADLTRAYLVGAYLSGADLTGAYLVGADLGRADLAGANLGGANLTGAYLARADLTGAYLVGAYLVGANLTGANLTGAYLAGAYLARAYLSRADLSRANLNWADLAGADLAGANLTGANLVGANLTGANLTGAYLARAYLGGAEYDVGTIWPTGFDPAQAGAVLVGAK